MRNQYKSGGRHFLMNCRQAACIIAFNIQQYRRPLSQLETIMILSLRLRFFSFFKDALLPYLNRIVKRDLVKEAWQLKHIFSTVSMNLHAWFNVLDLRTNDIS
jgi:hypothetical protein